MRNFIDLESKRVLITNYNYVDMGYDSYTNVNCNGYGRIRKRAGSKFQLNSYFFEPKPLNRKATLEESLQTQTFQLAACNLQCWYCYVDKHFYRNAAAQATFLSAEELLQLYLALENPLPIIELSGGEPDLAPEWCLWVMQAIENMGLDEIIHIWSDCNLSTYGVWDYLTPKQISYIRAYPNHNRIGCLKGIDDYTCKLNSRNRSLTLEKQLDVLMRYIKTGFKMYLYATFTSPANYIDDAKVRVFIKKLQDIDYGLPLRTIPLRIQRFTSCEQKFNTEYENEQYRVFMIWQKLLLEEYGDLTSISYDDSFNIG